MLDFSGRELLRVQIAPRRFFIICKIHTKKELLSHFALTVTLFKSEPFPLPINTTYGPTFTEHNSDPMSSCQTPQGGREEGGGDALSAFIHSKVILKNGGKEGNLFNLAMFFPFSHCLCFCFFFFFCFFFCFFLVIKWWCAHHSFFCKDIFLTSRVSNKGFISNFDLNHICFFQPLLKREFLGA